MANQRLQGKLKPEGPQQGIPDHRHRLVRLEDEAE